MTPAFDVAVIGAGPAGAAAAMSLARAGRIVALIDRERVPRRKVGEALPAAARPLLKRLGFLEVVEAGPHLPCPGNVSSWGSEQLVETDFLRDPRGMGWHLDRPTFDNDLRAKAVASGATNLLGYVRAAKRDNFFWSLNVGTTTYAARWVIDATGRGAKFARRNGGVRIIDDDLRAIVAYVKPAKGDTDHRTLIEAVEDGWWYSAKLANGVRVLVFHTSAARAGELRQVDAFFEALGKTKHLVGLRKCRWAKVQGVTEASGSALELPFGDGWVAAGDAAMAFDPLSSQGIFNALYSGMRAGEAVSALLEDRVEEAASYAQRLEEIRQVYLARRAVYYGAETRWSTAAFWQSKRVKPRLSGCSNVETETAVL